MMKQSENQQQISGSETAGQDSPPLWDALGWRFAMTCGREARPFQAVVLAHQIRGD